MAGDGTCYNVEQDKELLQKKVNSRSTFFLTFSYGGGGGEGGRCLR